jgi:hypothetical protein
LPRWSKSESRKPSKQVFAEYFKHLGGSRGVFHGNKPPKKLVT